MTTLFRLMLAAAAVYLLAALALVLLQRRIVFRPDPGTPEIAALEVPGATEIHVAGILGWYRPAAPGQPTLLYFHGNAGSLTDRIPRFRRYAENGWGLLFMEYPGYGGQPGSPSEAAFARSAQAAADELSAMGVPPARLVLYGESIGTGVATRLAESRPAAALILESPYTSIRAIGEARYPWLPVRLLARDPFEIETRLPKVHVPVLILQGGKDDIVPPIMGLQDFAAANEPKQLWSVPEAGHENLMQFGAADVVPAFVAAHVPGG